ncbi:hypothetical protein F0169_02650 [Pseudomonas sp. MAFF 212408]|uniref:Uncharacterized protein n=1 Tax=Pseudomonas kitaguniensis TaxID=2607908 RepID=A0A5N7KG95_9PSED|nr:hypothetical protein [Pseudomonas kitaguniensis]MPR01070.1 hypothetical protein [Pseudomonas kitaguniensis]
MTSIDDWPLWIAIFVSGGPILLGFIGLAFSLYLTHRHLDAMKEALKNSRYIYIWGDSLGKRGVLWSLLEMSKIAGMITMPKVHLRLGDLDPVDLENFPRYLKRLLISVTATILTSFIGMIVVAILLKFR